MSFEHPTPDPSRREIPHYEADFVDLNAIEHEPAPKLPYTPKGFKDIYAEAKWLRKLSGNTAIAFMLIFMTLLFAGAYADSVELRRMNPEIFAMVDSMNASDSSFAAISDAAEASTTNIPAPGFLERFGLKLLSALGSIGFFIFAGAAVSEISFRAYEGREIEPYDVLDTLTKSHGLNLLQLGLFFLGILLIVGIVSILGSVDDTDPGWAMLAIILLFVQLYVQLRTMFSVQSMIGEELTAREALARSWKLTKGNVLRLIWWTLVFGVFFVLTAIFVYFLPIYIIGGIIGFIFSWFAPVIAIAVTLVALALMVKHFSLIFFFQMALYRELRLRLDGEDPVEIPASVTTVV